MYGTKSLSDILGKLVTVRGYGRSWIRQSLENAWNTAIGEPDCHQTRISEMRRGVLHVTVARSIPAGGTCGVSQEHTTCIFTIECSRNMRHPISSWFDWDPYQGGYRIVLIAVGLPSRKERMCSLRK